MESYYRRATEDKIYFRMVVKQLIDELILFGFTDVWKDIFIHRDCQVKSKLPSKTLMSLVKQARIAQISASGTRRLDSDRIPNLWFLVKQTPSVTRTLQWKFQHRWRHFHFKLIKSYLLLTLLTKVILLTKKRPCIRQIILPGLKWIYFLDIFLLNLFKASKCRVKNSEWIYNQYLHWLFSWSTFKLN